jgi:1,2-diacylglycerol 3-alpha-glucosyltransferase
MAGDSRRDWNEDMNIGIFSDSYRPYISGVVRSIDSFATELRKMGHKVYIFAPKYGDDPDEPDVFRFASVKPLVNQDFALAIPISSSLKSTIAKLELDVIHTHSPFLMGQLGAHCAKRDGIPLIFTYHTLYDQYVHYLPLMEPVARRAIVRYAAKYCNRVDQVITPTTVVAKMVRNYGVSTPITALPTGIDYELLSGGDPNWLRERYGIGPRERVLLFVGRLSLEKNLDFLLHAMRMVKRKLPLKQVRLVLVAGGPERKHLEKLAVKLGIRSEVLFTGPLPPEEVAHCYKGADLFTFPSCSETQGLVLIEAMAAGLPPVAIGANGVLDMVQNNQDGLLVDLDLEQYSNAIIRLLEDEPERQRLSQNAKIKAVEFSTTNMALKLAAIYEQVIEAGRGSSR